MEFSAYDQNWVLIYVGVACWVAVRTFFFFFFRVNEIMNDGKLYTAAHLVPACWLTSAIPFKKSFQLIRLKSRATGPQQSTYEKLNILQSLIVVKMIIYSMINNYWFYWVFVCLCFTSCCIQITNYYSFLSSFLWFFSIQNLFTADDWLEFDSAKSTISRSQLISIIVGVFLCEISASKRART